jgi:hypothetical protein
VLELARCLPAIAGRRQGRNLPKSYMLGGPFGPLQRLASARPRVRCGADTPRQLATGGEFCRELRRSMFLGTRATELIACGVAAAIAAVSIVAEIAQDYYVAALLTIALVGWLASVVRRSLRDLRGK